MGYFIGDIIRSQNEKGLIDVIPIKAGDEFIYNGLFWRFVYGDERICPTAYQYRGNTQGNSILCTRLDENVANEIKKSLPFDLEPEYLEINQGYGVMNFPIMPPPPNRKSR